MKARHFSNLSKPMLVTFLGGSLALMSGCSVVEGIFKAGVWVGVLAVFAVIALIGWGLKSMLS
jgi:phosphatidylserine synthase